MKKYWKVILNEGGKLILGSLLVYTACDMYLSPLNPDNKELGIVVAFIGLPGLILLADFFPSLWAIYKGTHKLLPKPLSSKSY